jgi:galactonate dehydratase
MRPDPDKLVSGSATHDGEGFVTISNEPGIGVALRADAAERYPYRKREILTRLHVDGSVVDQ